MNFLLRTAVSAAAVFLVIGSAVAETPAKRSNHDPLTNVELTAAEVVLPTSEASTLAMKACAKCPLKSYLVTSGTRYYVSRKPATLAQLNASVVGDPYAYVGVEYSKKTGRIVSVRAFPTKPVVQP